MNRRLCLIAMLAAALFEGTGRAQADRRVHPAADEDLPPELKALLLEAQPSWTASSSAFAGFGYNDNLLLTNEEFAKNGAVTGSAFSRVGADALLWHLPRGRIDYFGFANAEYTRFSKRATDSSGNHYDHKAAAFAGLEWRYQRQDAFTVTLDAQGYFLDQIFDVSDTEIKRVVADLKVSGVKLWPTFRWYVRPSLWIEGSMVGNREIFRDGLNNATVRDAIVKLGWAPTDRLEFTVSGTQRRRHFDTHPRYTTSGRIDEDTPGFLVVHERGAEARGKATWGASRHWSTVTRMGGLHYIDNASGYFNYRQRFVGQEVEWSAGKWLVRAEGEAKRRDYDVQVIGQGTSLPPVVRDEFSATLHVERVVSSRWTIFAEYNWERSRSNDVLASYRVNEGLLGARWSWEK